MCHDQGGTNHEEDQTTRGAGSRERHRERCHAHGGTSAGQPIKISKCTKITKPGSYLVTRNLTAVGDCLVLEARNVTLDLGGWITGDGAEDSTGVTGGSSTTERNGTVTNFGGGVSIGSDVIENVRADGEFAINAGGGSTLSRNHASGGQFALIAGRSSIVSGNFVRSVDDVSMQVGPGSIITGNTVEGGGIAASTPAPAASSAATPSGGRGCRYRCRLRQHPQRHSRALVDQLREVRRCTPGNGRGDRCDGTPQKTWACRGPWAGAWAARTAMLFSTEATGPASVGAQREVHMVRFTGLMVGIVLGCAAVAPEPALGQSLIQSFRADLHGFNQVPSISTSGSGRFDAELSPEDGSIEYTLRYSDLESAVSHADIHLSQAASNGGIILFLCSNLDNRPAGTQSCPEGDGEISGVITADDVLGPADQGLDPGEFDQLLQAMLNRATYVNVHTELQEAGEIRGQITPNTPEFVGQ
jgi:hypothetical protein